ncbi:nucleotidyltransferase domain-containing protein [bacterium]|nr:nucleotidyltransferase domain-containing protein [bacterium]
MVLVKEEKDAQKAANLRAFLDENRHRIQQIASRHGVGNVRLFGSVARGEAVKGSDVDLLVRVVGKTPPWFPGGLVAELEDFLGCKVDVVEEVALRKELRSQVLKEAVPL